MTQLVSQGNGAQEFTLGGAFDLASTTPVLDALAAGCGAFELNASAIDFIDSCGLRAIVDAVGARGAVFVDPSPIVVRFLALLARTGQPAGIACR